MKAVDLRKKSDAELNEELHSLLREQFNLRMQKGSGQLAQNHQLTGVRRNIAPIKTVLQEKKAAQEL